MMLALSALRHWKLALVALLLLALGVQSYRLNSEQSAHEETRNTLGSERVEHRLFAERVKATSERIARQALENARRIEASQDQIAQEVASDYQARISRLRADYDARLRQNSRGANPGGGGTRLPGPGSAPGNPDGAAPVLDPFACEANTIQLAELQRWIRETLMVAR